MAILNLEACKQILSKIRKESSHKKVVFVSGNFNVVHPGHLRMLNFASECGDILVVGVNKNNPGAHISEEHRLEGVNAIGVVDHTILLTCSIPEFIDKLKPDIVVKGKEHENLFNPEQSILQSYGGKLVFCAGEARFSSLDLLKKELNEHNSNRINKPIEYLHRHKLNLNTLVKTINKFDELKVIVVGDLIVDEYITCDPLGMSQEDPTIVVTPIMRDLFVGGAGIVAAHAKGLGAKVDYFGVCGNDEIASFAQEKLAHLGVNVHLIRDINRPTTHKQRFRARGKTLLRVSHLRQHAISSELINEMLNMIEPIIQQADLLIFSDFNYGCLPQNLVDKIISTAKQNDVMMAADSQASSQIGDVSRFLGMKLITPTEHEARISTNDKECGLVHLAESIQQKANADHIFITLGSEGVLIYSQKGSDSGIITDQLPALNEAPKDVSGAGDSMLTCASMALATGANIWESAYLASIAAACQVGRVGNLPLTSLEVIQELIS